MALRHRSDRRQHGRCATIVSLEERGEQRQLLTCKSDMIDHRRHGTDVWAVWMAFLSSAVADADGQNRVLVWLCMSGQGRNVHIDGAEFRLRFSVGSPLPRVSQYSEEGVISAGLIFRGCSSSTICRLAFTPEYHNGLRITIIVAANLDIRKTMNGWMSCNTVAFVLHL